ncbi:MAG TPA: carbohydrate ABC transporter permease [Cellulomonas sp.]
MSTLTSTSTRLPVHARRRRPRPGVVVARVYIALVVLTTVFPVYWMLRTALSSNAGLISDPGSLLPVDFSWGGFERVLGLQTGAEAIAAGGSGASIDLLVPIRNSVIYAGVATFCQVFFASLAAYAFSRLQWRGRDLVFRTLFTALMVPGILTLLPNFLLIKELGLMNSFAGLILPGAFFSAFNIFFLRQFFLGMSAEIEEAALLDGASRLRVFFRITMPLAAGPVTTVSVLGFITYWNDYFWPLLVTSDDSTQPLTLALAVFKQSSPQAQPDWAGLMAAALVAALPMLLVFAVFGRKIVNSLGFSGIR